MVTKNKTKAELVKLVGELTNQLEDLTETHKGELASAMKRAITAEGTQNDTSTDTAVVPSTETQELSVIQKVVDWVNTTHPDWDMKVNDILTVTIQDKRIGTTLKRAKGSLTTFWIQRDDPIGGTEVNLIPATTWTQDEWEKELKLRRG